MIKGHCRTNLDGYEREQWPERFVSVPRNGDRVQAKSGKILKVVGITHSMNDNFKDLVDNKDPYIEIELGR